MTTPTRDEVLLELDKALCNVINGVNDDFDPSLWVAETKRSFERLSEAYNAAHEAGIMPLFSDASPVQPVLEWRPVETCPKDEEYYLMTGGKYPCLATWDDQDEEWFTFNGDYERVNKKPYRPTHWMPCPPPAPIGDK